MRTIYKISAAQAWHEAERLGVFRASPDDRRDGFIHLSTNSQIAGTLAKHFAGQNDLFLVAIDADALGDALKWEASRGGELFPHLYGDLDLSAVRKVSEVSMHADGSHQVPEHLP